MKQEIKLGDKVRCKLTSVSGKAHAFKHGMRTQ